MSTRISRPRRVFYGHWLVLVSFVILFLAYGCGSYAFSLFVTPLEKSFGWSRGQIMAGFTVFFVSMGLVCPLVGRFVDHHGARGVVPLGAAMMGLGFLVISRMSELHVFYAGYVLVGMGAGAMGQVPAGAVISNWFARRRGTAIGIMASGIGAGGLMAPLVGSIIAEHGWRNAYLVMGCIISAVVIPLGALVIRTRPSDIGLRPYGAGEPTDKSDTPFGTVSGITLGDSVRTRAFWLILVSYFLGCFASIGLVQSPVPHLQDIGFPIQTAASALGATGIGSGIGKFAFGWLCDRMQARNAWILGQAIMASSVLILVSIRAESSIAVIWMYSLLVGFGAGAWLPTLSVVTTTTFGLAYYGAVFGVLNLGQSVATATGPFFAGLVYDATGTYFWAFVTFGMLFMAGMPLILLVRKPVSWK